MKKEIAGKWAEALRSGKYVQGKGRLKVTSPNGESKHCCLGVLCEMAMEDGLLLNQASRWRWGIRDGERVHEFHNEVDKLPDSVREWAGIKSLFGAIERLRGGKHYSLSIMNDEWASFDIIADHIERHAEEL